MKEVCLSAETYVFNSKNTFLSNHEDFKTHNTLYKEIIDFWWSHMFDTSLYVDTYNTDNLNMIIITRNGFFVYHSYTCFIVFSVCLCYITI